MRLSVFTAACVLAAGAAHSEPIMPSDVAFDDYGAVTAALTDVPGDAAKGAAVFKDRKKGNCLACHQNSDMSDQSFHGEVGPLLDGAGDRWEQAELRGIVTNAKKAFEGTIMPAFYINAGYTRPLEDFDGQSILSAQEVEDVVAYLMTLKEN